MLRRIPLLIGMVCALIQPARAGTSFCSGSYSLDPASGIPDTSGCEQVDKIFSAFSYFDNSGNGPSASSIFVTFGGTTSAGPITDAFTSPGWTVSAIGTSSVFLFNSTQVDQVASPGSVITGFDFSPWTVTTPGTCTGMFCDTINIYTTFCTNSSAPCAYGDPNYGQFQYVNQASIGVLSQSYCYGNGSAPNACTNGASQGPTSFTFDPSLKVTSIYVTNEVVIANWDGLTAGISGFSNDFFESTSMADSPEPGTFLLFGLGIGVLLARRRK